MMAIWRGSPSCSGTRLFAPAPSIILGAVGDVESMIKEIAVFRKLGSCLVFSLVLAFAVSAAQPLGSKTGWIDLVKGHIDETSGADVRDVQPGEQEGTVRVTLAIPKTRLAINPNQLEEVRVVGRRPEPIDLLPDFRYEWVANYDNDHYGLIIHLRDDGTLPLRLFLDSKAGFVE